MKLADAIVARKARDEALRRFPPEMDRLRGDELEQIEDREQKSATLREALQKRQRSREAATADLKRSGLAESTPAPEEMQSAGTWLEQLGQQSVERKNVRNACAEAGAAVKDALAQFNDSSDPPKLDADALRRADEIAMPLLAAQSSLRELREHVALAGETPDASEIERRRNGFEALRAWLAGNTAEAAHLPAAPKWPLIAAVGTSAVAALIAYLQSAWFALAGALAAFLTSAAALFLQHGRRSAMPSPTDDARRRFHETDLAPPPDWTEQAVRLHLREVESQFNELTLQRDRAARAEQLKLQVRETEVNIEELEQERTTLARKIGFDPRLPVVEFHRFVHLCAEWDTARTLYGKQSARLALLDRDIAEAGRHVRDFLDPWRAEDAPSLEDAAGELDMHLLRGTYEGLRQRIEAASAARNEIRNCDTAIDSLQQQIADIVAEVEKLFAQANVKPGDRAALADRIEQLPRWQAARQALDEARTEEKLARADLAEQPGIIALADEGKRTELQTALGASARVASEHTRLIQQQAEILTKLNDAGTDCKLEQAGAAENRARQALEDRRDEALLAVATTTLLDEVEQTFEAEHEPDVLRRAREVFADVTARAFDLRLHADGTFVAHDVLQDTPRALGELSSGTRMQLLLALRLAWTAAQEQGGEALPLFLDEALTTSDEKRFAVMARSLERIAGAEDGRQRQIFYLSARRHERALWRDATGTEPALIDLAAVRYPPAVAAPETYRVEQPPGLPAPDGASAEEYASRLGVPHFNPHQPPGGVHLFYLVRDDLTLLHALMDTWSITTLGQLEALLASDAAQAAVTDKDSHHRLRRRCRAVQAWIDLWRRGRGRPVDRGALEGCGAISAIFIVRTAALSEQVHGDGKALVDALRAGTLPHFHSSKVDELEQWLADEGYTDDRERLTADERRRLSLQRAVPETEADAGDVNQVVNWLEAAAGDHA